MPHNPLNYFIRILGETMKANTKKDRRSLYTEKVIKEAFITLLDQKPLEKTSISEICRLADINKSTFYLHYQNEHDILKEFEDELVKEFAIGLKNNNISLEELEKNLEKELRKDPFNATDMKKASEITGNQLTHMFEFCEKVFNEGNEILILVTELTINYYTAMFISRYGCKKLWT